MCGCEPGWSCPVHIDGWWSDPFHMDPSEREQEARDRQMGVSLNATTPTKELK